MPRIVETALYVAFELLELLAPLPQTQWMMLVLTEGLALVDRLPRQPCGYDP